jgi:hypothetical protein
LTLATAAAVALSLTVRAVLTAGEGEGEGEGEALAGGGRTGGLVVLLTIEITSSPLTSPSVLAAAVAVGAVFCTVCAWASPARSSTQQHAARVKPRVRLICGQRGRGLRRAASGQWSSSVRRALGRRPRGVGGSRLRAWLDRCARRTRPGDTPGGAFGYMERN